ncbi:MAG TPA: cell wall hydrolase [Sphingomicrobium sp.]|nr:cell wall hydrolase [Sphingomicrobium sp.]
MSALLIVRRKIEARLSNASPGTLAFGLAGLVAIIAAMFVAVSVWKGPAQASVTISLAQAREAALVAATSGQQAIAVRAVGEQARLINASLPFSAAPVQAARSFVAGGDALDHRRALLCLTQAVYYEAGYEPIEGRRAVAQVVLNRMRHPAYPKSICGVVYQRDSTPVCQFSFVCDGSLLRAPAAGAWREAENVARAALAGYVETSVGSATHYHADYVAPRWAPMLSKVAKLGVHIFYRWPGAWGMPAAFTGRYIGEPNDPASLRPILHLAVITTGNGAAGAVAGPPIARAENDVGGLLDTSKGWTLNIPLPSDASSGAAKLIAEQQARAPIKTTVAVAAAAAPVVAAR